MVPKELYYTIALSMIPGIGHIRATQLIEHCGSATELFENRRDLLYKVGKQKEEVALDEAFELAKAEIDYMESEGIKAYSFKDDLYPKRLKECADRPVALYSKGKIEFNKKLVLSFVGSRNATVRGKEICRKIISELAPYDPLIVSGLAYGIDITAHKAAMENDLQTIAVLGSGLKIIYPPPHARIAEKMQSFGGIISDYPSETKLLPSQFAERNRIVAGLSDSTIVIESAEKGGSLITARLALEYNRDVYAVPGRPEDDLSAGCNLLIKKERAALIESAEDIVYLLGLDQEEKQRKSKQIELFQDLSEDEQLLSKILSEKGPIAIDDISQLSGIAIHKTSVVLLGLEFKGIIKSLPGKMYQLL